MSYELVDTVYINRLQEYDQYAKLNSVQITIKSSNKITDLGRYENYKYHFQQIVFYSAQPLQATLTFSLITYNGLNEAKKTLISAKLFKFHGGVIQYKTAIGNQLMENRNA